MTKSSGNNLENINYAEKKTDGLTIRPLSYILCANNIPDDIHEKLSVYAKKVIKLPPFAYLPAHVSTHPDMLIFDAGDSFIVNKKYYFDNMKLFDEITAGTSKQIVPADDIIRPIYPYDIRYNCLKMGDVVFGRSDFASIEVTKRYNVVNVRQGYARCSCCKLTEYAIITADRAIAKKAAAFGIDVLLISGGNVALTGYNYGFIGGASASIDDKTVLFFGCIGNHPDYAAMQKFAHKHKVDLVSLGEHMLYDFGGIMTI